MRGAGGRTGIKPRAQPLMVAWLLLALAAVAISLLYALLLVLARSGLGFLQLTHFQTALVLHVDFSLFVWFMAIAALLWSWIAGDHLLRLGWGAWGCSLVGAGLMTLSPLLADGAPVLNDYLPILQQGPFIVGMGSVATGVLLAALRLVLLPARMTVDFHPIVLSASKGSAAITLLALPVFLVEMMLGEAGIPFWAVGHLLQLNHMLLFLSVLFCISNWLLGGEIGRGWRADSLGVIIGVITLAGLSSPLSLLLDLPVRGDYYTGLMEVTGSLVLVGLLLVAWRAVTNPAQSRDRFLSASLFAILLLFLLGSVAGFLIRDNSAMVPAHYHGVIGAVTLAYMVSAYRLLPLLGLVRPSGQVPFYQVGGYTLGLVLVIAGLLVSDLPRKSLPIELLSGAETAIGRGLMGLGGTMAVLSCLLFIWIMVSRIRGARSVGPLILGDSGKIGGSQ